MLSKALAKYIISLQSKKGRRQEKAYALEGEKLVLELLASQQGCQKLIVVEDWLRDNFPKVKHAEPALVTCSAADMKKISALQTPSPLLAVAEIAEQPPLPDANDLIVVLDGLQDPGNLGTIIRTIDWFGMHTLIVSPDTVDAYNPKTVQSAMGSLLRVAVIEKDLNDVFKRYANVPVYAADMHGDDVRTIELPKKSLLLIGNEGNGIKPERKPFVTKAVSIPRFGKAESLNAAVATAVLCACWKLR